MTIGRPPTRSAFDNAQRHVRAFRPISEAARSWSCDNCAWTQQAWGAKQRHRNAAVLGRQEIGNVIEQEQRRRQRLYNVC